MVERCRGQDAQVKNSPGAREPWEKTSRLYISYQQYYYMSIIHLTIIVNTIITNIIPMSITISIDISIPMNITSSITINNNSNTADS